MTEHDDHRDGVKLTPDYRSLPPRVRPEDTIGSVETSDVPDPEAGRNEDQHRALRDD